MKCMKAFHLSTKKWQLIKERKMDKIKLNFSHEGAVANLVLDDGKGNVLDAVMMAEMLDIFESLKSNPNVKLITFQGEGKHYSFGASVPEHTKDKAADMISTFHKLFTTMMDLSIPTLSMVSGQCLGGGMELALFSNFIFADETANFAQPEIVLAVFPPPASIMLPLKLGQGRADDIVLTGRNIKPDEAMQIGLVNEVFEDKNQMQNGVDRWIEKFILPKSASSLRYGVKAARSRYNQVLREHLQLLEDLYVNDLMQTDDANEGINSFLEKRQPAWSNH